MKRINIDNLCLYTQKSLLSLVKSKLIRKQLRKVNLKIKTINSVLKFIQ